jgi:dTMP kinase
MRGNFIVIQGLDGCGKSTQLSLLREYIESQGRRCEYIHFPMVDQGVYGKLIAEFLRGEYGSLETVHPKLVALLFANDRLEHVEKIRQWIAEGAVVLADRYVYSNVAYQCAKLSDSVEKQQLKEWILDFEFLHNKLPEPEFSFFLNVPFEAVEKTLTQERTGEEREYLKGKEDIHENALDFQKSVYQEYIGLLESEKRIVDIQCYDEEKRFLSKEEIHQKIVNYMMRVR